MKLRNLAAAAAALTLLVLPAQAWAASLTLNEVLVPKSIQQTDNRPCVIGDTSCNYVTPIAPPNAVFPDSSGLIDITSAQFYVSTIETVIGSSYFWIGLDVNQSNVTQTIEFFGMYINGNLVDSFGTVGGAATDVPTTVGGGNGNGYADWLFKGFTSLASFNDSDIVTFRAIMPLTNDGKEQFFLVGTTAPPCPDCEVNPLAGVPEPATLMLFGTGLAALAVSLRRRRT